MNLNTLRHIKLLRGGEIRAWALRQSTWLSIHDEQPEAIKPTERHWLILDIPVVLVGPYDPEGVIV